MLRTECCHASESRDWRWRVWGTHVPAHAHVPPCTPTCAEAEPSCSLVSIGNQAEAKILLGGAGGALKRGPKSSAPREPRCPSWCSGDSGRW